MLMRFTPRPGGIDREAARLQDLVSMVAMLDSPVELPETFATARQIIDQTLSQLL